ncbi:hypothetical protein B0H14DRAFT_2576446 [Mycena olivaceomarginata]|nr:hypothetical protein B0H14DRAFT_2576446 [Mycena olivaceomarginata]
MKPITLLLKDGPHRGLAKPCRVKLEEIKSDEDNESVPQSETSGTSEKPRTMSRIYQEISKSLRELKVGVRKIGKIRGDTSDFGVEIQGEGYRRKRAEWLCKRIKSPISSFLLPSSPTLRPSTRPVCTQPLLHPFPMFLTLKLASVSNFGPPIGFLPFSTTVLGLQEARLDVVGVVMDAPEILTSTSSTPCPPTLSSTRVIPGGSRPFLEPVVSTFRGLKHVSVTTYPFEDSVLQLVQEVQATDDLKRYDLISR